jgi:phosphatidylserine/phosphatidylglycerophosphate/cardiolipin synthase-like enzyme
MDQLVKYLSANFGKPFTHVTDLEIVRLIKRLNREERGELRYRLFNESRRLDAANNGQQAIFWLQNCFELIDKYMFQIHKVYFSPGTDILESLSSLLSQATRSLDLCIFTITDGRLAADLLDCLERGIQVRILTDNDKMYDNGSVIQDLKNAGIPIKIDHTRYHMHHKFGIIDSRIIFTGSFNWTYTASSHNQENMLVTTNFDIVKQYEDQFEQLWNEMFNW